MLKINLLLIIFFLNINKFVITQPENFKKMIEKVIPLRKDGKIDIPQSIKHIKLDIGLSYTAPMSQHWLTHEDDLLVFGFEPNPGCINSILSAIKKLNKKFIEKNFFLIPCALGLNSNTMMKFYITANDWGCSSIYLPNTFPIERVIDVPMFSLSDFFDFFPFDTHPVIDYIKIDAQGSDLNIVKSAGKYLKERVIYVTLEAEYLCYKDSVNSLEDIKKYMISIGFIQFNSPKTVDPTFFNPKFSEYIKTNNIQIYQVG